MQPELYHFSSVHELHNSHRFLTRAIKEAEESTYTKHKVGAVIFKGKRIISVGRNWAHKWVSSVPAHFKKWPTSIHAEVDALIKAGPHSEGNSILVVRIGNSGNLLLAHPCVYCEAYMHHCGIRKVYYSTNEGTIESYRLT
jgi:deoxycytidylate deaminase